jgi:hypothetical protein
MYGINAEHKHANGYRSKAQSCDFILVLDPDCFKTNLVSIRATFILQFQSMVFWL